MVFFFLLRRHMFACFTRISPLLSASYLIPLACCHHLVAHPVGPGASWHRVTHGLRNEVDETPFSRFQPPLRTLIAETMPLTQAQITPKIPHSSPQPVKAYR